MKYPLITYGWPSRTNWTLTLAVGLFCLTLQYTDHLAAAEKYPRVIPVRVEYAFYGKSEIQDSALIRITGVRLFREKERSMYYFQALNKTDHNVSIDGDLYFFDQSGNEVYKHLSAGYGTGEIMGQAAPGASEGVNMSPDFFSFNLDRIARARITLRGAWTDNADRD